MIRWFYDITSEQFIESLLRLENLLLDYLYNKCNTTLLKGTLSGRI